MRKEAKIRDSSGKILYYIVTESDGRETVYDRSGRLIGFTTLAGTAICDGRSIGTGGAGAIIAEYERKNRRK